LQNELAAKRRRVKWAPTEQDTRRVQAASNSIPIYAVKNGNLTPTPPRNCWRRRAAKRPTGLRDRNGGFQPEPPLASTTLNVLSWSPRAGSDAPMMVAGGYLEGRWKG
jgi:hypothetical protein